MIYILIFLIIINILFTKYLFNLLKIESRRNRILQSFIAWIIRSISDYYSATDSIDSDYIPEKNKKLPISYKKLLESIQWEFSKDFWINPYKKWIEKDRLIFNDDKYWNDWFNFMYLDFFDELKRQWDSDELINKKDKELIKEWINITEENLNEIETDIIIFKDYKKWKLKLNNFNKDNIDEKLNMIFNYIKPKYIKELKEMLLKKNK